MIQEVSAKLLGQFTACLEQRISNGGPDAAPAATTPQPRRPAEAAPAARGAGPGRRGGDGHVTGPGGSRGSGGRHPRDLAR